jgi:hypothetical protein
VTYIVTIKLPRNKDHDPKNKKTGKCQVSDYCTDVTGQHHSYLETVQSEAEILANLAEQGIHVTRIEQVR